MSDPKSFIEPFKNRLLEVFNSSSQSEDGGYRHSIFTREERKRKKEGAKDSWEEESLHLFEDFLSLDEEKITHGLAKAKVRKALDKKYAQSRQGELIEHETRALEDTLDATTIAPEITARKLALLEIWMDDLARLLRTRYPALSGWVNLLSRPAWVHLAQQGMQPRFLLNLMILAWYRRTGREASDSREALLYLQLHIQYLNLGFKSEEIVLHLEKYTLDVDSFESLLNQTLHALERNGELLESFETLLKVRCSQARRYFLRLLGQPWLDPDKRLARFHLNQRFGRLRSQLRELRERLQTGRAVSPEELVAFQTHWRGQSLALVALNLLNAAQENLPLREHTLNPQLQSIGLSVQSPDVQKLLGMINLERLERWIRLSQQEAEAPMDPGFISDAVIDQALLPAIEQDDWTTLEKWALLKSWYGSGFRQMGLEPLGKQLDAFLPPQVE